jgi:hypothetical protein
MWPGSERWPGHSGEVDRLDMTSVAGLCLRRLQLAAHVGPWRRAALLLPGQQTEAVLASAAVGAWLSPAQWQSVIRVAVALVLPAAVRLVGMARRCCLACTQGRQRKLVWLLQGRRDL